MGVVPDQPEHVVLTAAGLARDLGVHLVLAHVDASQQVWHGADGSVYATPLDPDQVAEDREAATDALREHLAALLERTEVMWDLRALVGDPAQELARLAAEEDARLVVLGTRRPGWRGRVEEFFTGSVAVRLAHHQHRPVLVVPAEPVDFSSPEPWR